jgi:hypothetical protein
VSRGGCRVIEIAFKVTVEKDNCVGNRDKINQTDTAAAIKRLRIALTARQPLTVHNVEMARRRFNVHSARSMVAD